MFTKKGANHAMSIMIEAEVYRGYLMNFFGKTYNIKRTIAII